MKILAIFLLLSIPVVVLAQSKKVLKNAGVVSRTEKTNKVDKKGTINYLESTEKYDSNGNRIEVIEYKSDGNIKKYNKFEYNDKGKLIYEQHIDPITKKPKETIEFTYSEVDGLIKEVYYNNKLQLSKTVVYTYENQLKTEKKVTNSAGKVIETKTYTYEK